MKSVLALFLLSVFVSVWITDAAVSISPLVVERIYNRKQKYCEYNGLKLRPGSVIKKIDGGCEICRCRRKTGLECATTATIFGGFPDNSTCMPIIVRCNTIWVYREAPYRKCADEDMPESFSAVLG